MSRLILDIRPNGLSTLVGLGGRGGLISFRFHIHLHLGTPDWGGTVLGLEISPDRSEMLVSIALRGTLDESCIPLGALTCTLTFPVLLR